MLRCGNALLFSQKYNKRVGMTNTSTWTRHWVGGAYPDVSTVLNNNSYIFVYSLCLISIKLPRTLLRCKIMSIILVKQKKRNVVICSLLLFSALIEDDQSQSIVNSGQAIVFNNCIEFSSHISVYMSVTNLSGKNNPRRLPVSSTNVSNISVVEWRILCFEHRFWATGRHLEDW